MATIFSKIIKGTLIGAGTVLSLVAPRIGGNLISKAQAIGAGAIAAGGLIKGDIPTLDTVTSRSTTALRANGLLEPATFPGMEGTNKAFVFPQWTLYALGALVVVYLLFKKK